jgi:hypothetical protein
MEASLFFHWQVWKHPHERLGKQPATDTRHSRASVYAHILQPATR